MRLLIKGIPCLFILIALSPIAFGDTITSPGDSLLSGATVITFSEVSLGTLNPTISGVSFEGLGANTQVVTTSGNINSPDLDNNDVDVEIQFATPVTAFGMDLLLVDRDLTIWAYDASNMLLGSAILLSPAGSIVNDFRGIGNVGLIASAIIDVDDEYIRVDNFHFVNSQIPEPTSLLLLGTGLGALGLVEYRRKRK